ncbi:MAG TPA: VIT1/CCC1 transporter family protein [Labilithrix sp.]|nr:VIT1/CCC1 transporter family protein [Labilithrix sp.]
MDSSASGLTRDEQRRHHTSADPHVRGRWLSDVVLGAQDGLVNTLGVVLGVAAASGNAHVVFASGMAAGIAEALSMAAVGYTTSMARGDLFRSEREREYRHVEVTPEIEREEVRILYARKGFDGELLERVVETICTNKDVWVALMMSEEHELTPIDRRTSLRAAAVVGVSALAGAVVPVVPFLFLGLRAGVVAAIAVGAALLFALGAFKASVTAGRRFRSGYELAAIGMASAIAGYAVGALLAP